MGTYEAFADEFSAHAADSAYNAHYDRPAVMSLLNRVGVRGRRVLDAGCGPGFYAEELLAAGAEVTGVMCESADGGASAAAGVGQGRPAGA